VDWLRCRLGHFQGLRSVGRRWVVSALRDEVSRPDEVTIIIGIRNRADYRLVNALRSIRGQTHPGKLLHPLVVDYGSGPAHARRAAAICKDWGAEYLCVDNAPVWSRSRCLNVGIRRTETKFLMLSDVDILLSPGYVSDAVAQLRASPSSIVCAPMLDLPKESAGILEQAARSGEDLQLETWKQWSRVRRAYEVDEHTAICIGYTALFKAIRGFDEYYEEWAGEDDDLMRRIEYLGLALRPLQSESFYLHQWHADSRGRGSSAERIRLNREHFRTTHSILRNGRTWGIPGREHRRGGR
jgi:hypothetical protein